MPNEVGRFPGSGVSTLPWEDMANGSTWLISHKEMEELGVKTDSVRAYAHAYAKENGVKFRTKLTPEGLFLERR